MIIYKLALHLCLFLSLSSPFCQNKISHFCLNKVLCGLLEGLQVIYPPTSPILWGSKEEGKPLDSQHHHEPPPDQLDYQ